MTNNSKYSNNYGYLTIKDWKDDEKPRERLIKHGADTLTDSELLAIIIGSGTKGKSAIDCAKELLQKHVDLISISKLDVSQIKHIKGVGLTKAISLVAVFELGRRIKAEPFDKKKVIKHPEDVANIYIPKMLAQKVETFHVLLLNSSNQIFRDILVSEGTLNASIVHPREIFRYAITESAAGIILLHNHPSGNPEPSQDDIEITRQLQSASEIIDINILDHIIIADEKFTSFSEKNLL